MNLKRTEILWWNDAVLLIIKEKKMFNSTLMLVSLLYFNYLCTTKKNDFLWDSTNLY